ncbi:MAG: tetratricopeptide repeat protein [Synergistales bacterium]|nr:tetratricopeptide repeat protein [Synergistales bacterium]
MKIRSWYLWLVPGLAPLLLRPTWSAWLGSVLLSATFHVALAATVLWPELLPPDVRNVLWLVFFGGWIAGVVLSWRFVRREQQLASERELDDTYPQALHAYLRGDRALAESLVRNRLRQDPQDVEAALLLASVWRRQGRLTAARSLLSKLRKVERAAPWLFEIDRELEILDRLSAAAEEAQRASSEAEETPAPQSTKSAHAEGTVSWSPTAKAA